MWGYILYVFIRYDKKVEFFAHGSHKRFDKGAKGEQICCTENSGPDGGVDESGEKISTRIGAGREIAKMEEEKKEGELIYSFSWQKRLEKIVL